MAAQPDLWGEVVPAEVRTPLSILREQASLLGAKTNNLVEATVTTATYRDEFVHRFLLVVPGFDNYTYELFRIAHGIELYPVFAGGSARETEEKFIAWLKTTLSSDETKRIISNLFSQARS